jgi:hypothetical protein
LMNTFTQSKDAILILDGYMMALKAWYKFLFLFIWSSCQKFFWYVWP